MLMFNRREFITEQQSPSQDRHYWSEACPGFIVAGAEKNLGREEK